MVESKDDKDAKGCMADVCTGGRIVTIDEKIRLLDSVHKDPAVGHFGIHKTYVIYTYTNRFHYHYNDIYI